MSKRRPSLEVQRERNEVLRAKLEGIALKRAYDAAQATQYRKTRRDRSSGDRLMDMTQDRLRAIARYLDENHDLAIGILDDLVNKICGADGVQIEPMARQPNGALADRFNTEIRGLWDTWTRARPDTSRTLPWCEAERLVCRTWLRDGEQITHHVEGGAVGVGHTGPVPYSLELLEPDYLPLDDRTWTRRDDRTIHGIECNAWGRPIAYHLYYEHPGDIHLRPLAGTETKRVPADRITHIKHTKRLGQKRGVTVLHGVLTRLDDLKEYEESERIAARVAAAFTAYIRKSPEMGGYSSLSQVGERMLEMAPGMIFDDLLPGEEIGTVSSDRPNSNLGGFRDDMLRAIAAGTGVNASSISRNYRGTFSSQRQEMIEARPAYARYRTYFVQTWHAEIYRRFVEWAITLRLVNTAGVDLATAVNADFGGIVLDWIDPLKEARAQQIEISSGTNSRHRVIRSRGRRPADIDAEIEADTFEQRDRDGDGQADARTNNDDADDASEGQAA